MNEILKKRAELTYNLNKLKKAEKTEEFKPKEETTQNMDEMVNFFNQTINELNESKKNMELYYKDMIELTKKKYIMELEEQKNKFNELDNLTQKISDKTDELQNKILTDNNLKKKNHQIRIISALHKGKPTYDIKQKK